MKRLTLIFTATLQILYSAPLSSAEPKITARLRVLKAVEAGHVEIYVRVPFSKDNTGYSVAAYCRDREPDIHTYRQLDEFSEGRPEPPIVWKRMPACHYQVIAMLHGKGGDIVARTPAMPAWILCFPCDD